MEMLAEERQAIIRDRLSEHGKVLANALALEFRVSEDTVRRDLRDLARAGLCRRVYGGALARASEAKTGPERSRSSTMDLAPLAAAGAKLVQSGATIMMHHGALSVAFAGALPRDMSLTIVTNSLLVATAGRASSSERRSFGRLVRPGQGMLCWNYRPFAIGAVQRRHVFCRRLRGPCFRRIDRL
ncbi:MAG: DeoR/GlpR transcriptional regulator [Mesorhizobium sp.]|nr:MAG: DeoR/GlpR transcriptional regulator [Mesorhizobium sp.]